MTPDETAVVLAKVVAYDRRTVGKADIAVWHETIGDLHLDDCLNGVAEYYRQASLSWLMPGALRGIVLGHKTPADRTVREALGPVNPGDYEAGITQVREALNAARGDHAATPQYATARRIALRVACPWCHMPPGTPCVVASRPPRPLTQLPAHWGRLDAAGAVYELPRGMPADEPAPGAGSTPTVPTTSPRQ